ncbi:hypothetical protein VIRA109638_00490 [Vibrio rarus]
MAQLIEAFTVFGLVIFAPLIIVTLVQRLQDMRTSRQQ